MVDMYSSTKKEEIPVMSSGSYAISMLSVGLLFFVIGYGYYKGKSAA